MSSSESHLNLQVGQEQTGSDVNSVASRLTALSKTDSNSELSLKQKENVIFEEISDINSNSKKRRRHNSVQFKAESSTDCVEADVECNDVADNTTRLRRRTRS